VLIAQEETCTKFQNLMDYVFEVLVPSDDSGLANILSVSAAISEDSVDLNEEEPVLLGSGTSAPSNLSTDPGCYVFSGSSDPVPPLAHRIASRTRHRLASRRHHPHTNPLG